MNIHSASSHETPGVLLITGAAKRLGRAIAVDLASKGWPLLLHYRSSAEEIHLTKALCQKAYEKLGVSRAIELIQGDFSSEVSIGNFVDELETRFQDDIYGVINNVGHYFWEEASKTEIARSRDLFLVNFHAPSEIMRKVSFLLKEKGRGGRIVNIGTPGLHRHGADTFSPMYSASKAALYHLTKSYAKELAPYHISVNMVSPGKLTNSVDTDLPQHSIPYGRLGDPEEVSRVVSFLCENSSGYITGQNIEVSGGFCL